MGQRLGLLVLDRALERLLDVVRRVEGRLTVLHFRLTARDVKHIITSVFVLVTRARPSPASTSAAASSSAPRRKPFTSVAARAHRVAAHRARATRTTERTRETARSKSHASQSSLRSSSSRAVAFDSAHHRARESSMTLERARRPSDAPTRRHRARRSSTVRDDVQSR